MLTGETAPSTAMNVNSATDYTANDIRENTTGTLSVKNSSTNNVKTKTNDINSASSLNEVDDIPCTDHLSTFKCDIDHNGDRTERLNVSQSNSKQKRALKFHNPPRHIFNLVVKVSRSFE